MDHYNYLNTSEPAVIEDMYNAYRENPESVDIQWRKFFEGFEFAGKKYGDTGDSMYPDEFKVINLINAYRQRGHLFTKTNPVRVRRTYTPTLDIENFGLTESDLDRAFLAGNEIGIGQASLRDIIDNLQLTYCGSIGVEFTYVRSPEIQQWLRARMEAVKNTPSYNTTSRKRIFRKLSEAVLFEKFIHKRFPGQKRFSLEGNEALIPALDAVIEKGVDFGIEEYIIGMPHRGRLNVLVNILQKSFADMFSEFHGLEYEDELLLGDVKYHLGYTSERQTASGKGVKLTLSPNPSHLEAVNPVVEGIVRSRIDNVYRGDHDKIIPVLIHGDAAISGQGIVYEVLQMSGLAGYKTGGTIHLVVNNQIGFTTNYTDGRTSTYCTDIAKTVQSPVFHVNADDVEAVVYTIQLAMEFREKFNRDVFVDLLGYRKYGHNESDEPRFTQPILYKIIENHPDPREIYAQKLLSQGVLNGDEIADLEKKIEGVLEQAFNHSKVAEKAKITNFLQKEWEGIRRAESSDFVSSPDTSIDATRLTKLAQDISSLPSDKKFFRKIVRLFEERLGMTKGEGNVDWALAEQLAYASLLEDGFNVRVSGQDVERGTFSHRHAVLTLEESEEKFVPLKQLNTKGRFEIFNSPLSEYGVLGFEYGYALTSPDTLTIWEAQFGDFSNGAQIIFDQFISSAEDKWNVQNGLVVFLPHGYEGQGPEHSSARMERYLSLCAENNFQVAYCTTPANLFHLIRRQLHREIRVPLVVFTPKSLLRHPKCISPIKEFTGHGFRELIDDESADPTKISRVIMCTGKVYYDLLEEKESSGNETIAILRLEQLFPIPETQLLKVKEKYHNATRWLWVQEEPANMGAWTFLKLYLDYIDFKLISRPASGSPATGSSKFHFIQQKKIVDKAFHQCNCPRLDIECRMVCIGNQWQTFAREALSELNESNTLEKI